VLVLEAFNEIKVGDLDQCCCGNFKYWSDTKKLFFLQSSFEERLRRHSNTTTLLLSCYSATKNFCQTLENLLKTEKKDLVLQSVIAPFIPFQLSFSKLLKHELLKQLEDLKPGVCLFQPTVSYDYCYYFSNLVTVTRRQAETIFKQYKLSKIQLHHCYCHLSPLLNNWLSLLMVLKEKTLSLLFLM
jgi:hypothetical protein